MKLTKWYKWGYYKHGANSAVIRRYRKVDGKVIWESYPKGKYKDFSEDEIRQLIVRLNLSSAEEPEVRVEEKYDKAFINEKILGEFRQHLETRANSREHIQCLMTALDKYTFEFFVNIEKTANPNHWKRLEAKFGNFLMKHDLSAGYIKRISQTTNRYVRFLHDRFPEEVRALKLEPVSDVVLRKRVYSAPNYSRMKFVDEESFEKILERGDRRILSAVKLGYYFGLRRAEVLAVDATCLFEDALQVDRQMVRPKPFPQYKALKTQEQRLIPYWFCSPEAAYRLISQLEPMHPDTLSDIFARDMKRLELPFQFHDLRRTFITRALRVQHFLDVKLAAGHSDLKTTNKYIQDDRKLQRKLFSPACALVTAQ